MARILIVDDEKSIRITLKAFLTAEGYDVAMAEDVRIAREILKQEDFDIVISDIILPRISGVALLQEIKQTAPDVQVIMMTGEPTVETSVEAVRAGASDYLTKPVGKSAVLYAVRNALKVKNLEDDKRGLEEENQKYRKNLELRVEQRTGELKDALHQLKKAQKQLIKQERMNALGQMASGIAHDFNNVLMPIIGFSEVLVDDPDMLDNREETIHMLEMIRSAGEDARHIVRRLRQIYKTEDAEYGLLDLAKVVESVLSMTTPKWKEEMSAKGVTIEIVTEFEKAPLIRGNVSELREAFTNLIFNAVDAMNEGGTITVEVAPEEGRGVVLKVSDTGVGMDEETARRCIEPFYTTKGMQGTGLGLPMVHGIMQRHGAIMEIEGKPGVGASVRMRFPIPINLEFPKDESREEVDPLPPMRVLIVDDEARSRNLVSRFLESDNHIVEMADGGQKAIDMANKATFDLVITDRAMPLISGDEVAAEISRTHPELPIIMLTGFGDIMKANDECPAGVSKIMSKPVTSKDLRYAMSSVMREA